MISQQALAALVTALVAFISGGALTRMIERWSKARADASRLAAKATAVSADTENIEAKAIQETLRDLRRRLDDRDRRIDACEQRHAAQDERIAMMQRQIDADTLLIVQLNTKVEEASAKAEADESLIRGIRTELDELRRVMRGATSLRKVEG